MDKRLLFAITPKAYWIILLIALLLRIPGGEYLLLSNLILNLLLFFFGIKIAVFLHESGHLAFARLVGGTPRRMVLGKGHQVHRKDIMGIRIVVHSNINSGLAFASFNNLRFIRLKLLAFTSGGFVVNFLAGFLLFLLFGLETNLQTGVHPATSFGMASVLAGFASLVPYASNYHGMRFFSDGLSLLKIPFYSREHLKELSLVSELLDAYDLLEIKEYDKAIRIYENCLQINPELRTINLNLSMAYMKMGELAKSVALLEELLPWLDKKEYQSFKAVFYNALAWDYLLLNKIEEADHYSLLAYQLAPKSEFIQGTRGSVLIEKGEARAGINLLVHDVDFNFPNNHTLSASIYLSLAYHELKMDKEAGKYSSFVAQHLDKLDLDERLLYDRVIAKMAGHNGGNET